jgi:hypothetical protein
MKTFNNFNATARPKSWLEHLTVGKRAHNSDAFESGMIPNAATGPLD